MTVGDISALMLDRDGVINRELGRAVLRWEEFEFLPAARDALRRLAQLPVPILVLSNQSAIGRGWVRAETVDKIHARMILDIHSAGGRIDDVVICPHAPEEGCPCRKPQPGLLLRTAAKHQFDLRRAVMVGDSYGDVQAAQAVGATPVMVRSGHAIPPEVLALLQRQSVRVVADLAAFAEDIVPRSAGALAGQAGSRNNGPWPGPAVGGSLPASH